MAIICIGLLVIKRKGVIPYIRQILIVVLLFAINLRPMVLSDEIKVMKEKINCYCIIVFDDTLSMMAEDSPDHENRMAQAKEDAKYITEQLNGAKFCILDFNNDANLVAPFTDDRVFIDSCIDMIRPIPDYEATGTNISCCKKLLGQTISEAYNMGDGHIVVFFISDGENTDDNVLESFADISDGIETGAVMGYGTANGGQMHYYDEYEEEYILVEDKRDYPYSTAISKIDEDNLEQIASDLELEYIRMDEPSDLDPVLEEALSILDDDENNMEETTLLGYSDTYFYFVIPLALLVAYEFISVKRRA